VRTLGRAEEQGEQHEHGGGAGGRHQPNAIPRVTTAGQAVRVNDAAGGPRADETCQRQG
jgi:hypothetical protein